MPENWQVVTLQTKHGIVRELKSCHLKEKNQGIARKLKNSLFKKKQEISRELKNIHFNKKNNKNTSNNQSVEK